MRPGMQHPSAQFGGGGGWLHRPPPPPIPGAGPFNPHTMMAGGQNGVPGGDLPPFDPAAAAAAGGGSGGGGGGPGGASKRRRRDASSPLLDAEAQLLLLGLLSAVVGDANTLNQCLISAVGLETQQEQQRAAAAAAGLPPPPLPPPSKLGVLGSYKLAQKLAAELRGRPALSLVFQLNNSLSLDAARR